METAAREFDRDHQFQQRLERLLKVAAESFNQKGFSGTSLKDVAAKLMITDAALYYYVSSKENLVFLCYQRALDLGEQALSEADSRGTTGLEKVEHYIRLQLDALCGPQGPVAILSEIPSLKASHRETLLQRARADSRRLAGFIRTGIEDGSVRACDPELTCAAIMGSLNWVPKWYHPGGHRSSIDQIAKAFVGLANQGLQSR
ncbi:MAG: TetR/AcrR family transcriptional regulator [Planctomycetes bacterium]|nr:TetR/AcrR family transcriptional regulator [Planctomycetota bacterium]